MTYNFTLKSADLLYIYFKKRVLFCCTFWLNVFLFISTTSLFAQVISHVTISPDTVLIGDAVNVNIKISVPVGVELQNIDLSSYLHLENQIYTQDTNFLDKEADLAILDFGQWKHNDLNIPIAKNQLNVKVENGQQIIQNTIRMAIYNMGIFKIVGPKINSNASEKQTITEAPRLIVKLPESIMGKDSTAFNPIKDIMREESNITDYLTYLYILVAICLIGLLAYFMYKKKNEVLPNDIITHTIILSPYEKAMQSLISLDEKQLWQKGHIKEYQSELTHIIRVYLEEKYDINALEMTTDEIIRSLSKSNFNTIHAIDLTEILQIADLVKFAKATPSDSVHGRFMDKAIAFVENTKEVIDDKNDTI